MGTSRHHEIMKLLIVYFSALPCYLVRNIFHSTLFYITFSLCSSLSVRGQIPHPKKIAGTVIVVYTLTLSVRHLNAIKSTVGRSFLGI